MIRLLAGGRADRVRAALAERIVPIVTQDTPYGPLRFFCPGKLPEWRARTLLTKEPETLEWIDGFDEGDLLWDIGANVGVYTLYAALKGHRVCSFEPAPGNLYLLSRNLELNGLDSRVHAYGLAFGEHTGLDTFHMGETELGGALNTLGEAVDWLGRPLERSFRQAVLGFRIDDFLARFRPPFPHHVKIDVDGLEDRIVHGGAGMFRDARLKSVLVELDDGRQEHRNLVRTLEDWGFRSVKKVQPPEVVGTSFGRFFNHVFLRPQGMRPGPPPSKSSTGEM